LDGRRVQAMRISIAMIGWVTCLLNTPAQAWDMNDVLDYFASDKEYAAYECPSSADAEICGDNCRAWTARKIKFKLDEAKDKLIIWWVDQFVDDADKCSILDKRNWECSTQAMVYKMKNGHLTRTRTLSLFSGITFYHACFK